jgi:hypothetical protein
VARQDHGLEPNPALLLWDQSDQLPNMIGLGTLALLENPDTLARI